MTPVKRTKGSEEEPAVIVEPVEENSKDVAAEIEEVPKLYADWKPITSLGRQVKEGKITSIDQIFDSGQSILETKIVDHLLSNLEEDLLLIGQAKGKFGGGQRRIFRQTQKKTKEGNRIKFTTIAVVGNRDGYVGIGAGKSNETVPSRDKAKHSARLNLIRVRRGSGTWESNSRDPTSIPFAVTGRCGSVRLTLLPAPKGKGLCIEKECAKILALAGVKDIWSKTEGQTKTKLNLIYALMNALHKLSEVKIQPEDITKLGIVEGSLHNQLKQLEIPAVTLTNEVNVVNEVAVSSAEDKDLSNNPSNSLPENESNSLNNQNS